MPKPMRRLDEMTTEELVAARDDLSLRLAIMAANGTDPDLSPDADEYAAAFWELEQRREMVCAAAPRRLRRP